MDRDSFSRRPTMREKWLDVGANAQLSLLGAQLVANDEPDDTEHPAVMPGRKLSREDHPQRNRQRDEGDATAPKNSAMSETR